ncbi:hypothetical protein [Spartinivicinus poritis]|uniref:LAGLIDADG homing endonuclease n=1 Tax=Spartinivicinus poritis TaxID=2994640 RepID=A0ABT5UBT9_9GAMM|nr:hypothetical protein [Spartinivicinus sp. A2-2]MDE1462584.1 hypothetical protein [Spartinivicinus sp. A2-2]
MSVELVNNNFDLEKITDAEYAEVKKLILSMDLKQRSSFLEQLSDDEVFRDEITQPIWLVSNYSDNVWICDLKQKNEIILDFRIYLDDDSLLTDTKNFNLLNTFKFYLCALTSRRFNGGKYMKWIQITRHFKKGVVLIDSLLTRSKQYQLGKFGLELIGRNEIISLLADIYHGCGSIGAYRVFEKVSCFFREKIKFIDINTIDKYEDNYPLIRWKPNHMLLDLSHDELIKARVWLLNNNFFSLSQWGWHQR